ncbi:hypothetical protein DFH08DRAFT_1034418 [Mycena albidolilacea]|uniref:Uncharacterized protein n=1 Tax=Mycena albidolilacea TaxID=1033008 RepID=A0AAD6ZFF3_9AGAR|nr:hypothetical protein DFH08DRAFT_1034418 [Mycena albidolilacea]
MWLIGACIPPVTSQWQGWTDVIPLEQLWETISLCTPGEEKPMALLTDINRRTGSEQVPRMEAEWPRISSDETINTRGREILCECGTHAYGLCILNGTSLETASPGRYTSWQVGQPTGKSTIDYAIVSKSLLPLVKEFHVEIPTPDPKGLGGPHAHLS